MYQDLEGAIRKTWKKMKPHERFLCSSLIVVGVIMIMIGISMVIKFA